MEEDRYLHFCFDLARRSGGKQEPNPMVGAAIVYQKQIIGQGFHEKYGEAHAEINALRSVHPEHLSLLPQSTLYVTLEPCSHHGKTPPCADAIIKSGIRKVIVGTPDPNPLVAGQGIQKLRNAGIEVVISGSSDEARMLIGPFRAHLQKRPYVILKCVKSKDNFMGKSGEYVWLSNGLSKIVSHVWRGNTQAILTGKTTVLTDDPALTTRDVHGHDPIRVLIDPNLECGKDRKIFSDHGKVIVFNSFENKTEHNVQWIKLSPGDRFERDILESLYNMGIYQLLIEGGAFTLSSFLKKDLWDEARVISTPVSLSTGIQAPDITGKLVKSVSLGDNMLKIIYRDASRTVPH